MAYVGAVRSVRVRVPAKINLALRVGAVRPDGYHPLSTVYQAIDLYDEVTATTGSDDTISIEVTDPAGEPLPGVPADDRNLAARAALALRERLGRPELGVRLSIRKAIPVAGGMAGGSADAAGALVACNELWHGGLTRSDLDPVAAGLGSDVPFLLHGGNALGTGRGEQVTPVLSRATFHWVIGVFSEGMSTPQVYAEYDRLRGNRVPRVPAEPHDVLAALGSGSTLALARAMVNDLTDAALSLRPELRRALEADGVLSMGGIVSGSGPTVAFLVPDERGTELLAAEVRSHQIFDDVLIARGPVPGARVVGS